MHSVHGQAHADAPVIVVGASLERVRWDVFEGECAIAEQGIIKKLHDAKATVVVLPVQSRMPERLLKEIDGILLTGGHDMCTSTDQADEPEGPRATRDDAEFALARTALERDIPLLGICRGCQVLNAAAGGSLIPHVPDRYSGVMHTKYEGGKSTKFEFAEHIVRAVRDTPVAEALGETFSVLSSHHQAVDELGEGLLPAAWSDDGLLEAFYSRQHRLLLGVQWHPENEESTTLFELLVAAASEHALARRA